MSHKSSNKVPTVGTKNLGKQKTQDVETATELATSKGTSKQKGQSKQFQTPKPGEGG